MARVLHSALFAAVALAGAALAGSRRRPDPARRAPAPGEVVRGPILHVTDDLKLCVALGPTDWVEVAVLDAEAPHPGRDAMMSAAFAKDAVCVATGRHAAACRIEGRPLATLLRQPGLIKAQAWR